MAGCSTLQQTGGFGKGGANTTATGQAAPTVADTVGRSNPGFNRKTLELSGNYFFAKRSSVKVGWES